MIRTNLLMAWRSLTHNKLHSFINVSGLTIGISTCLLIFLLVHYEWSFNRNIPDKDKIYRIYSSFSGVFEGTNRGVTSGAQAYVSTEFTGIATSVKLNNFTATVSVPSSTTNSSFPDQSSIALTDANYFTMFPDYNWLSGNPKESLNKAFQVVLTEKQANKYFPNTQISELIGKELHYNDSLVVTIVGIVQPPSYKTDFTFTDFISFPTIENSFLKQTSPANNWDNTNSSCQLFIKATTQSTESINDQLNKVNVIHNSNNPEEDWNVSYKLQPLDDIHFNSTLGIFDTSRVPAHKSTLLSLAIVAALILLMAIINFVNLETAQAVNRAKEVGVRKVLGSSRRQLIAQFLLQSIIISSFAVLLSLPVVELSLTFFSDFVPPEVSLQLTNPTTSLFIISAILTVGIMAGIYPAFVLSSLLPARALKNQINGIYVNSRSAFMRKSLIIFQFGIAQALVIGTIVIISQIKFMLTSDLGFKQDAIINIDAPWTSTLERRLSFKNELQKLKEVEALSFCNGLPASTSFMSNNLIYKNGKEDLKRNVFRKFGDEHYLSVFDITLLAGRNLLPADSMREILINETYAKEIGLTPQEAIGQVVWDENKAYPIVGVVKDFAISGLSENYQPVYMACENNHFFSYSIRLMNNQDNGASLHEGLAKIEDAWNTFFPEKEFEYQFFEETIRNFYVTEQKMSKLATTAMIIALIICCMGLYGLSSFTSIQRTKEIGIRKVLGASVQGIVYLLTKEFVLLVILAFFLAIPFAYYATQLFLDQYAFKTSVSILLYLGVVLGAGLLAFLTVSIHTIQAAKSNPSQSLKSE